MSHRLSVDFIYGEMKKMYLTNNRFPNDKNVSRNELWRYILLLTVLPNGLFFYFWILD